MKILLKILIICFTSILTNRAMVQPPAIPTAEKGAKDLVIDNNYPASWAYSINTQMKQRQPLLLRPNLKELLKM